MNLDDASRTELNNFCPCFQKKADDEAFESFLHIRYHQSQPDNQDHQLTHTDSVSGSLTRTPV